MGALQIFLVRAVLSVLFAFLISRVFFQNMEVIKIFGLATILLGLAYLLEYLKKRDRGGDHGS